MQVPVLHGKLVHQTAYEVFCEHMGGLLRCTVIENSDEEKEAPVLALV
jgi:hypothetical protein